MELHNVHLLDKTQTEAGWAAAAIGIFFDTVHYDQSISKEDKAIVDSFFESLKMGAKEDAKVTTIPYKKLLGVANFDKRWVYKGSLTTPPCNGIVWWNVIRTVLPISKEHLAAFKKELSFATGYAPKTLDYYGNWRETQPVDPALSKVLYVDSTVASREAARLAKEKAAKGATYLPDLAGSMMSAAAISYFM